MIIINWIDRLLNRITMYRVVLYYLIGLIVLAAVFGFFGLLPYDGGAVIASALFFVFMSEWMNDIFSKVFDAPVNVESTTITALILALIVPPVTHVSDFLLLAGIALLAVSSKYFFNINKKHLFNPAAAAVVLSSFILGKSATWWVGNPVMAAFVLVGGLLVVRKVRREAMVWTFFGTVFVVSVIFSFMHGGTLLTLGSRLILHSSLLFLAFAMLTEPLTSPHTRDLQIAFGAIVGFLFVPNIHFGSWYPTPEEALCLGNIFSYAVSPRERLLLYLKEKIRVTPDIMDFIFAVPPGFRFTPGQYMEWTLPHANPDSRGNRRYFTIASAPGEDTIRLGVKFYAPPSSYKKALVNLDAATPIVAAQRAGDFVLPLDTKQKVVLIAGGIGVTPYRSMIAHLLKIQEKRDIVVLYAVKRWQDIVYKDIFTKAEQELGIRTIYTLSDVSSLPRGWAGRTGRIDATMIMQEIPDYRERVFYLSGPYTMVHAFEDVLTGMGVHETRIKKDFFPGFV